MAGAKHPLVAAHRPYTAPHLIRQRLERQPVISRRQSTAQSIARPLLGLGMQEQVDRLLEASLQQMQIAGIWDPPGRWKLGPGGDEEAIERVKEEAGPHPFVEIIALAAEGFQFRAHR